MSGKTVHRVALGIHVGAWAPLGALAWMAWQGHLGPVPVAVVTRLLGRYALTLLLLSLVPTAIRIVFGVTATARFRRPLGLYAFFYALLHVMAFVWLDYRLALDLLIVAVFQSRRELVGLAAFAILTVLAVTSIPSLAKRLGRPWKRIHRSVYPAAFFVVLHAIWNYKELRSWPLFAGAVLLLLLIVRIPPVTSLLRRWRRSE